MFKFFLLFFLIVPAQKQTASYNPDRICGKWISSEKNIIVQVYRDGEVFKGKLIWFENIDTSKAMDEWTDAHNPDAALRNRKLIGMNILKDLYYIPKTNSWENGKIYDAKAGREWSASVYINAEGLLKVTGYWHLKFIGRTMTFTKA